MKDLIDHMSRCHDQLQWAGDGATQEQAISDLRGALEALLDVVGPPDEYRALL